MHATVAPCAGAAVSFLRRQEIIKGELTLVENALPEETVVWPPPALCAALPLRLATLAFVEERRKEPNQETGVSVNEPDAVLGALCTELNI